MNAYQHSSKNLLVRSKPKKNIDQIFWLRTWLCYRRSWFHE